MPEFITKYFIKLDKVPTENITNGLTLFLTKKFETKTEKPITTTNINKYQDEYELPPNVKPEDVLKIDCPKSLIRSLDDITLSGNPD